MTKLNSSIHNKKITLEIKKSKFKVGYNNKETQTRK